LITFVDDRPGHDRRYAIDARRIHEELNWRARYSLDAGLCHTVQWYLDNESWWGPLITSGNSLGRLGLLRTNLHRSYDMPA
jgi:dTDP-glucose 4,6-dehydratase